MLEAVFEWLKTVILMAGYVSGSQAFPKPLTPEEEEEYIRRYTEGDKEAKNVLIERNLRLVAHIMKKYYSQTADQEDLISIGTIGLIKAIDTYRMDKNIKLATYASRCIENEILMHLRKSSKTKLEVSIDEPLNVDWDGNELLLSDILGTDEDVIYKNMEEEAERSLLKKAIAKSKSNLM